MRISDWSSDVCSSDLVPGDMVVQRFRVEAEPVIFGRDMIGRMLAYEHHRGSAMLVQYLDGLRPNASACGWLRAHWSIEPFIQTGRASCRERVLQYIMLSVVAVSLKKKK